MIKTIEELKAATEVEINELLECFKGNKTEDFQKVTGCEFTYSTLSTELTKRGYENFWHKPKAKKRNFTVKMIQKPARFNLGMTPECKKAYEEFIKANGWGYVHTTAALMSYMEAYKKREIKVSIDV